MLEKVPHPNLFIGKCVNTFYGNYIGEIKNGYLISASWEGENVSYGLRCNNCKDSMDMYITTNCHFCYDDISSLKCYETFYSQNCEACVSSYFLYDCKNCSNCFGCTNLRGKSYCLWNKQLTKEEYEEEFKKIDIGNYKNFLNVKEKFENLKLKTIRRFANITHSQNVSGDDILNTTNCKNCFGVSNEIKDCKFVSNAVNSFRDSYDGYGLGANSEQLYEALDSGVNGARQLFTLTVWECLNAEYCFNCHGCNNIFGCVGLRNKSYCIFNIQYTKEEFKQLREKIIKQMEEIPFIDKKGNTYKYGEYFPMEISPFGYNETVAQDYFKLSKQEILGNGYGWVDRENPEHQATLYARDLPKYANGFNEDILNLIIRCETCERPYKIIKDEYILLNRFGLPLPRKCFECRHQERFNKVNPMKLWHRQCMCDKQNHDHEGRCPVEFETSYAPERPEIVYCEKCYQKEVY